MDVPKSLKWGLTVGLIVAGATSYFMADFQSIQSITNVEQCPQPTQNQQPKQYFFHPYIQVFIFIIQTLLMFMGESLCLIFAAIDRFRDPKKYLLKEDFAKFSGKYRPKVSVYIIPALLDFLSSICMFAAIGMISGSTYQFMRSGSLITTALFSRYFAKLKFKKHQKWACVIAFGSLLLIALSQSLRGIEQQIKVQMNYWIGVALMLGGICLAGMYYAYEQRLFLKYYIEPLRLVGMEGLYGIIMTLIATVIVTFIPCYFRQRSCVCVDGQLFVQSPRMYLKELQNNNILIVFGILMILSLAVTNMVGVLVTKYINAPARSILDSGRGILVWIIGVILTVSNSFDSFKFQSLKWYVVLCKVIGLATLIVAVLVYNELIQVKKLAERRTFEDYTDDNLIQEQK